MSSNDPPTGVGPSARADGSTLQSASWSGLSVKGDLVVVGVMTRGDGPRMGADGKGEMMWHDQHDIWMLVGI